MRFLLALLTLSLFSAHAAELVQVRPPAPTFELDQGAQKVVLESDVLEAKAPFDTLISSWNAVTPAGSWLTLEVRARVGEKWTRYYSFGTWASGSQPKRSSVDGQKDAQGALSTDTLKLNTPSSAFQYRLSLHNGAGGALPKVSQLSFALDRRARALPNAVDGDRSSWGTVLDVPRRSQMVFPQGEGWCSPTSLSMVLAFWGVHKSVPEVASSVFDAAYGGTGNWPFNTAYAASLGLSAYVARLEGLGALERFIAQGQPVIASVGFGRGELKGAPVTSSEGHLLVVVGFDKSGNVVVNDPAGRDETQVRRTYARAEFERAWLGHSRGTVYVVGR